MTRYDDILYIAGSDYADKWYETDCKIYHKDNIPYGLVLFDEFIYQDGSSLLIVRSCSKNNGKFTKSMFADMLKAVNERSSAIVVDKVSENIDSILAIFNRLGFYVVDVESHKVAYRMKG